jgi:dTDP-L-rhamnose 4-epimerase
MQEQPLSSTINVGTGKAVTLLEVVGAIAELVNKPVNYTVSGRFRVGDIRHAVADMSHYETLLGKWQPTSLKDGLAQYLEWYLEQEPLSQTTLQASFKEMERTGLLLSKHD